MRAPGRGAGGGRDHLGNALRANCGKFEPQEPQHGKVRKHFRVAAAARPVRPARHRRGRPHYCAERAAADAPAMMTSILAARCWPRRSTPTGSGDERRAAWCRAAVAELGEQFYTDTAGQ
jgi:hypothetical protein